MFWDGVIFQVKAYFGEIYPIRLSWAESSTLNHPFSFPKNLKLCPRLAFIKELPDTGVERTLILSPPLMNT